MSKVLVKACWFALWLGSGPLGARAAAQTTINDVLRSMAARAGVIFSGHVEAITRNDPAGFVDIRFRIDQPVRGCPRTGAYVLREWVGLWTSMPARYEVGQRLLMLLAARGPSGISAPVDGLDGVLPIVALGVQPMADRDGAAPAEDGSPAPELVVDLRRLQTRVLRTTQVAVHAAGRSASPEGNTSPRSIAFPGEAPEFSWAGAAAPLQHAGQGTLAAQPVLSAVLALLGGRATGGGGAHVAR